MSEEKARLYTLIYDLLLRSGGLNIDVIADVLKVDVDYVEKALQDLIEKKLVAKIDNRFVALPKIEFLVDDIKELEEKIDLTGKDIHSVIDEIMEKIVSSYSNISDIINEKVGTIVNSLEIAMAGMESEYKTMISQNITALKEFSDAIKETARCFEEKVGILGKTKQQFSEDFKQHNTETKNLLLSHSKEIFDVISKMLMEARDKYIENVEQNLGDIQKSTSAVSDELVTKIDELTSSIKELTQKIDNSLNKIKDLFEETFNTLTNHINESKTILEENLYKVIDGSVVKEYNKLADLLTEHSNTVLNILTDVISKELDLSRELKNNIAAIINMIGKEYTEISNEISSKYGQIFEDIKTRIISGIEETKNNILTHVDGIKKIQINSLSTLETILRNDIEKLREYLLAKIDEVFVHSVKELKEKIVSIEQVAEDIKGKMKILSETLDNRSRDIIDRASDTISKFLDSIENRLSVTKETIDQSFLELEEKVKVEEISSQMKTVLKETIRDHMTSMKNLIIDIIGDIFNEIKNSIAERIVLSERPQSTNTAKKKHKKAEISKTPAKKEEKPLLNEIREQVDTIVADRLKHIEGIINKQISIIEDSIVEVILNVSKNVLSQNQQYTLTKIGDTKTLIANELSWVKSEIRSRMSLFLDKINTMLTGICDYTKNWLNINVGEIEEKFKIRIEDLGRIEDILRTKISEVKISYQEHITATEKKTIERIKEGKEAIETSITTHIERVSELLKTITNTIDTQIEDASNSFKDVVTKLDLRMRNLIDKHLASILEELSKHHANVENIVREASKNLETKIATLTEKMKVSIFDMKEIISQGIANNVTANIEKISSLVEAKKNEVINGISENHEGLQSDIFDKIRHADQISLSVSGEFKKLSDDIKTIKENMESEANSSFESLSSNMSESYNSLADKINEDISNTFNKIEEKSNKIFEKFTESLNSLGQRIKENLIEKYTQNIATLSNVLSSFENKFLEVIKAIKDPIKSASEEIKENIKEKVDVVKEKVNEGKHSINKKFLKLKESIETIPDKVYSLIERYVENIRMRPKGIFMIYGLDVLTSIIKLMITGAQESAIIVSHTLHEPIINAIKSASRNILIELYCAAKTEGLPENVCIAKRRPVPKDIISILVDNKKLLLIFENSNKQYIGLIIENIPVKPLIEGIIKPKTKK